MSSNYIISKCSGGWAISVDGAILLVCKRKQIALRIVREATAGYPDTAAATDARRSPKPAKPRGSRKPRTPAATRRPRANGRVSPFS
jgi:hypothetical protein